MRAVRAAFAVIAEQMFVLGSTAADEKNSGVLYFDDMPGRVWKIRLICVIPDIEQQVAKPAPDSCALMERRCSRIPEPAMIWRALLTFSLVAVMGLAVGCGKHDDAAAVPVATTTNPPAAGDQPAAGNVPGPMPTPTTPLTIAPAENGNIDATLAELTRELRRTMIGRRLSGSFEEFVAIRNLKVPPPPPGKKYAISKQWRVVLVDQ